MVQLKEKTLEELKKMASKKKIEGRSKMNKAQLLRALSKSKKMRGGGLNNNEINTMISYEYPSRLPFILSINGRVNLEREVIRVRRLINNNLQILVVYKSDDGTKQTKSVINIDDETLYFENTTYGGMRLSIRMGRLGEYRHEYHGEIDTTGISETRTFNESYPRGSAGTRESSNPFNESYPRASAGTGQSSNPFENVRGKTKNKELDNNIRNLFLSKNKKIADKKYKKLALKYHTNKNKTEGATERFQRLGSAKNELYERERW